MSWILDASGALTRGQGESAWWPVLVELGQASHLAVSGAYLLLIARFLRVCERWREERPLAEPLRQVSALLCICALAHSADALIAYLTQQRLVTIPSLLAAAFATVVASQFARLGRGHRDESEQGREATLEAISPSTPGPGVGRLGVADGDEGDATFEEFEGRVDYLEDTIRRNAWLVQRHEAIERLGALLAATPAALVPRCAEVPRPVEGPEAQRTR